MTTVAAPGREPAWRRAWRRFWDRAPRQLRFTRAGRVLVALAFAVGFAAINTGNNLLFLGWGLVLSAIVLSGVLSEAVVRNLSLRALAPPQARADEPAALRLELVNVSRRVPAYAVEVSAEIEAFGVAAEAAAPYELRIEAGTRRELRARFVPRARGRHVVRCLRVRTTFPFGFFEKGRRFGEVEEPFWVMPAAVPVDDVIEAVLSSTGESPARRAGAGEDFYGLRAFRRGDDPRRIAHRRSARTGRWVVRESEAATGASLLLELRLDPGLATERVERAIAGLGSLAVALLGRGRAAGVLAPGTYVAAAAGEAHGRRVLAALARLDPTASVPRAAAGLITRVVLVARPGTASGIGIAGVYAAAGVVTGLGDLAS